MRGTSASFNLLNSVHVRKANYLQSAIKTIKICLSATGVAMKVHCRSWIIDNIGMLENNVGVVSPLSLDMYSW